MQKKVVVEKDGVKKDISFRKILLNRCQKEFEKENSLEKMINEKLAHLVNQGLNVSTATELIMVPLSHGAFSFYFDGECLFACLMFVHRDVIKDWGFFSKFIWNEKYLVKSLTAV